jgi:two-component system, NarL family, sensor kinase
MTAVTDVASEHARRGVRLQVALRWVLLAFLTLTLITVRPASDLLACVVIVASYALWTVTVAVWTRRPSATPLAWLALFADVVVLGALTLITGVATPDSWTSDVVIVGLLLVPVLAATQLRPLVCTAVVVPTVAVYLVAAVATRESNDEPWASVLLRTAIAAGVALGCIGLSRIQASRVRTIGRLAQTRTELLSELTGIEQRERRVLSEHLHDGALQYVLAARQDLDEARETGDPEAFARLEEALGETSRLLRSTVAELHPAVLARAGLPAAVRDLATTAAARGGFTAGVDTGGWPDGLRTTADALLHRTARELLANVAEHAKADTATVTLSMTDGTARLVVADDGIGLPDRPAEEALGRGHIGLASHTVRIEAAGGWLRSGPGNPGTVMTVELPCQPIGGPPDRPV